LSLNSSIAKLWRQVFGEPLAIIAPTSLIVSVLVENLPPAPPYTPGSKDPAAGETEADI
jgi:hypothetical protein